MVGEKGYAYTQANDYPKALEDISSSIILLKQMRDLEPDVRDRKLLTSYTDLLQLYTSMDVYEQSRAYADSCWEILERSPDTTKEARLLEAEGRMHLSEAITFSETSLLPQAIEKYRQSCELYLQLGRVAYAQSNYLNIAGSFQQWAFLLTPEEGSHTPPQARAYYDSAFVYLEQHMSISRSFQRKQGELSGLRFLASLNQEMERFPLPLPNYARLW